MCQVHEARRRGAARSCGGAGAIVTRLSAAPATVAVSRGFAPSPCSTAPVWHPRGRAVFLLGVAVSACAQIARAEEPSCPVHVAVAWTRAPGAERCISPDDLVTRTRARAASDTLLTLDRQGADFVVVGRIEPNAGGFRTQLVLRDGVGRPLGKRTFFGSMLDYWIGLILRTGPSKSRMARRRSEIRVVLARACLASFLDVWSLKPETLANSEVESESSSVRDRPVDGRPNQSFECKPKPVGPSMMATASAW